jgi:hypothetical protein
MKRKYFILLLVLLLAATGFGQDKMEVKDADSNLLMQVNDEGAAGSITLPGLTVAPALSTNKLYNFSGNLFWNGAQLLTSGDLTGWSLTGNAGTLAGTNFIGTTDNVALDFRVNNTRAMRLEYVQSGGNPAPNLIGGSSANTVSAGVVGATIAGGGIGSSFNRVTADLGTVGGGSSNTASGAVSTIAGGSGNTASGISSNISGGADNTASGQYSAVSGGEANSATSSHSTVAGGENNTASGGVAIVAGGSSNTASGLFSTVAGGTNNTAGGGNSTVVGGSQNNAAGDFSVAAGRRVKIDAAHDGSFLFADQNNFDFTSASANEFAARATGGVRFVTAIDGSGNPTQTVDIDNTGTVTANAFVGDGSGLTGISGDNLGNHTATQTLNLAGNNISNGGTITATAFVGDGSGLTGVSGSDNLGNHTATQTLYLNGNDITDGGTVTATAFIGDGSGLTGLSNIWSLNGTSAFYNDGNVGIGTSDPQAPLHVGSTTTIALFSGANNGGAWMTEGSGAGSDEIGFAQDAGSTPVSIYANGSIVADGEGVFVAATVNWSDERIKNIEGVSDAKRDLETIDGIEITDYRRIDGGKREKKVIAQQLRKVFPQAVSLREGVIPSIYAHIEKFEFDETNQLLTIETPTPHELAVGDQIDYYTETGKFSKQPVTAVLSENAFQVEASSVPQELFVFGKWVSDVHVVDYDAVAMLNVSATQELHRIIEAQQQGMEVQQKRIAELEAQNEKLNKQVAELNGLQAKVAHIEMAMQKMNPVELTSAESR